MPFLPVAAPLPHRPGRRRAAPRPPPAAQDAAHGRHHITPAPPAGAPLEQDARPGAHPHVAARHLRPPRRAAPRPPHIAPAVAHEGNGLTRCGLGALGARPPFPPCATTPSGMLLTGLIPSLPTHLGMRTTMTSIRRTTTPSPQPNFETSGLALTPPYQSTRPCDRATNGHQTLERPLAVMLSGRACRRSREGTPRRPRQGLGDPRARQPTMMMAF